MKKQRKPLSTKIPPIASLDHNLIMNWMNKETMPAMQPLVKQVDELIRKEIPNLQYSIKWGKAFYGTLELGWIIEASVGFRCINSIYKSYIS